MTEGPAEPNTIERLPCGCRFWTEETPRGRAFVMEPCSLRCPNYGYAMQEMERQQKPVETWDLR